VTVTAADADSSNLSATTQFSTNGGAFAAGLPNGLSLGAATCTPAAGASCRWSLTGTANVPTGIYTVRFMIDDGEGAAGSADISIAVKRENAASIYTGDIYALTAGPTVTTAAVRLAANVTEEVDAGGGDITLARLSFELFRAGNLGSTPDLIVGGVAVDSNGNALTFYNLPVDVWTVKVRIDAANGYWRASPVGMGTIAVEAPTTELRTSGGGWVNDAGSANGKGSFGFNVASQKSGPRGNSVYLFRGLDGFDYVVKSNSWQGGGLSFAKDGTLISKASFSARCVVQKIDPATGDAVESFGNYALTVDAEDGDLYNPRQGDRYAITILNTGGTVWRQIGSRTTPPVIGGGNVTVKGK